MHVWAGRPKTVLQKKDAEHAPAAGGGPETLVVEIKVCILWQVGDISTSAPDLLDLLDLRMFILKNFHHV